MINQFDFTDKRILITGAGTGIGKETAKLLSKSGAKVILIDINEDLLKETFSCLTGKGHQFIVYDVSNLDGIEHLIKNKVAAKAGLDGFVNCVGIRSRRPLSMITPKALNEIMNVNFGSFIEFVRWITKKNYFNRGLSIVAISSISSQTGGASVTAYAASKAATDSAIRCLAKELAHKGIRLNSVVPAQINTPAYQDLMKMKGSLKDETLTRQYLGLGEPVDVANAIAFLLSDSSRFITGAAIPVDGGFLSS
jgi:NAD(P)-dependent dehydrogenase (short-subunit alcohol dehydrogenase family)